VQSSGAQAASRLEEVTQELQQHPAPRSRRWPWVIAALGVVLALSITFFPSGRIAEPTVGEPLKLRIESELRSYKP
jgi:hypothetical protein